MMYNKKIGVEKWVKKWGTKPEATKNYRVEKWVEKWGTKPEATKNCQVENWGTKLEPPAWTDGGAENELVSIWGYGKVVRCYKGLICTVEKKSSFFSGNPKLDSKKNLMNRASHPTHGQLCATATQRTEPKFPLLQQLYGGDWKCRSGKCDTVKISGVENAGVDRRVGKCRSGKSRSKLVWKAKQRNKQSSCTHFKRDTTVRITRSSSMLLIGVMQMLMQRVARVRLKQLGLDLTTCC